MKKFGYLSITLASVLMLSAGLRSWATDATLLPNARQQFFDASGRPLANGKVYFYTPSTTTDKTVWTGSTKITAFPQPVALDSSGRPSLSSLPQSIYGDGVYRQILKDSNGITIWDAITTSTGSSSGGGGTGGTGDGLHVGAVLAWAGATIPTNYLAAAGQSLARSTYPDFLTAITITQANASCASSNPIISGLADTTNIPIGAPIEISCLAPGATVVSKTSNSVTASSNATTTTTVTAVFFPWGNGNGSTTFTNLDLRGRVPFGRNNMNGSTASVLTSTYYGVNPNGLGALGGNQSFTMSNANLPAHSHAYTPPLAVSYNLNGGATVIPAAVPGSPINTADTGSSVPFSLINPGVTVNYIVKVIADSPVAGVSSIGGMQGDILCGANLTCTGGTISATGGGGGGSPGGANTQVQYNSSGSFAGSANLTWVSPTLTLGGAGAQLIFAGSGSGTTALQASAAASGIVTIPATTDTLVAKATTDIFTNKTFDTAATGNVFNINGLAVTNNTGSGAIARANAPSFVTPALGVPSSAILTNALGLPLSGLTAQAAYTFVGNNTGASAIPTAVDIAALTNKASPAASDLLILSDQAASGAWKKVTVSSISSAGSVASIAGNTGAFTLSNGVTNVTNAIVANLNFRPEGRLTVTTGVPVPSASVTGATTLYYAGYTGSFVPIYDGTNMLPQAICAEATAGACQLSAVLGANWTTNTNYDWFVANDAGTIRLCSGPAWTTSTAGAGVRGTGASTSELQQLGGLWTNKVSMTCRYSNSATITAGVNQATYVGTTRTTGAGAIDYIFGGAASGGVAANLNVWNMYNRVTVAAMSIDSGSTYTYSSGSTRQCRASAGNQISWTMGLLEDAIPVTVSTAIGIAAVLFSQGNVGIGVNATNATTGGFIFFDNPVAQQYYQSYSMLNVFNSPASPSVLPVGYNTIACVETSDGSNSNTYNYSSHETVSATIRM